jgi:tRNA U34 2-thiouridine synthase MnmA/TrmU
LNGKLIEKLIFPLGNYSKTEIRKTAREKDLLNFQRRRTAWEYVLSEGRITGSF